MVAQAARSESNAQRRWGTVWFYTMHTASGADGIDDAGTGQDLVKQDQTGGIGDAEDVATVVVMAALLHGATAA